MATRNQKNFDQSKLIITRKMADVEKDNPSWKEDNWPPGSDKARLTQADIQDKRNRKKAYLYDDIEKFKKFMKKHPKSFDDATNNDFLGKMDEYQADIDNTKLMTREMQTYIDKHQFFHRRFRREDIPETGKPSNT